MLEQLVECENRLLEEQRRFNELLLAWRSGDLGDDLTRMKIDQMQREVDALGRQLTALRTVIAALTVYIRTIFTPWLRYGSTSIAKNTRLRKISPAAQTGRIALPIVFSRSCFPDACWYPACAATGRGGVC